MSSTSTTPFPQQIQTPSSVLDICIGYFVTILPLVQTCATKNPTLAHLMFSPKGEQNLSTLLNGSRNTKYTYSNEVTGSTVL